MFDFYPTKPVYFHSIVRLAEVQDFVVPKDDLPGMEAWTMELFQRIQAEPGLTVAAFCLNLSLNLRDRQYMKHSWVAPLWRQLELEMNPDLEEGGNLHFRVAVRGREYGAMRQVHVHSSEIYSIAAPRGSSTTLPQRCIFRS
ncbi:hypothetical protein GOP47_0017294 [Adiantum capillus-veneris]|uniref:Uncharacterized protein n=1 Tax=Adiantum capillus-veneris TaxID=13818 RepID=A0A9D4UGC0_ADICA|nr:hypothetical protein GOP47_0017294 [Adiantum capillus-veneris]